MLPVFVEVHGFTRAVPDYFDDDEAYRAFQESLMANPFAGSVMRDCGGIRKVRWSDPRRGKGKRGGLRVIYLHLAEQCRFILLDVYGKDEQDDLSRAERQHLAGIARRIKEEYEKGPTP